MLAREIEASMKGFGQYLHGRNVSNRQRKQRKIHHKKLQKDFAQQQSAMK